MDVEEFEESSGGGVLGLYPSSPLPGSYWGGGGQFRNSAVSIYHYIRPFCFINYVPHIEPYLQVVKHQCTTGLSSVVHCWTECLKGMVLDEWSVKAIKLSLF